MDADDLSWVYLAQVIVALKYVLFVADHIGKMKAQLGFQLVKVVVEAGVWQVLDSHGKVCHVHILLVRVVLLQADRPTQPHCVQDENDADDGVTSYHNVCQARPSDRAKVVQVDRCDVTLILHEQCVLRQIRDAISSQLREAFAEIIASLDLEIHLTELLFVAQILELQLVLVKLLYFAESFGKVVLIFIVFIDFGDTEFRDAPDSARLTEQLDDLTGSIEAKLIYTERLLTDVSEGN